MPQTKGPLHAVPCPWCRKSNDFRSVEDYALGQGNVLSCDHCKRNFEIKNVQKVTMIWLAQTSQRGNLYQ
jgi:uncharacterized protein YbaR (Trm112 family)